MSVPPSSTSSSISSKILLITEEITSTIKALVILSKNEDLQQLNRLLYRSMDSLVVLKCQLLQQQVSLLSSPMYSRQKPESEDLGMTDLPISEKTSSSTSTPGKPKLKRKLKEKSTPEQSTSLSTTKETLVNLHSANICVGITKHQFWDGEGLVTFCTWCQRCQTKQHTYLISLDQSHKIGEKTTSLPLWRESKMGYSSTRNMNALKLL